MANSYSIDLEQGSSQYLSRTDANLSSDFPGKSSTGHTGDTTWEGWFNFESAGGDRLFGKYATGQKCFYCVYSTNLMYFGISANGTNDFDTTWSWTPTTGTWYHLAFVYDASAGSVEFFVDGVSQGTNAGYATALQQTTADFEIGDFTVRNAYFDGKIDDFRVWNDIRTQTQIQKYKNRKLNGNESGLVGYWQFNGNPNDSTSNNNHLTENNSPTYTPYVSFINGKELSNTTSDSTSEGRIYKTNGTSFSDVRNATDGNGNDANLYTKIERNSTGTTWQLARAWIPFNISSLSMVGEKFKITEASVNLKMETILTEANETNSTYWTLV